MSLLTLVQRVCRQINLPAPTTALSNADAQVLQLVQLLQNAGDDLMRRHAWNALLTRDEFFCIAQAAQTGHPPADFDRFAGEQKLWDTAKRWPLIGPLAPDDWTRVTIETTSAPQFYWTLLGGLIHIHPTPAATDEFAYYYVSNKWIRNAAGTSTYAEWAADTDLPRIPDKLLRYALVWSWKQAKGLDYAEDLETFEREAEKATAEDRGQRSIATTRTFRGGAPANWWPGTITVP